MAETGARTEIETGEKVVLEGDPMALRRLFANLLDNAVGVRVRDYPITPDKLLGAMLAR
jgi:hypothetical protein